MLDFKALVPGLVGKTVAWAGTIVDPEGKSGTAESSYTYIFFTDMSALCIPDPDLGTVPELIANAADVIENILQERMPAAQLIMELDGFRKVKQLAGEIAARKTATEQRRESLGPEAAPAGTLQPPTPTPATVEMPLPASMEALVPPPVTT